MGSTEKDRDPERLIPIGGIGIPGALVKLGPNRLVLRNPRLLPLLFLIILAKRHLAKSFAAGPPRSLCPDDLTGLGFVTSITFIFLIGVSSWLGASVLGLGEWFIKKMPLMSCIYAASKQISVAISPGQNSQAFKEVAIIRHPRIGEYALGFITSTVILRKSSVSEELCCVYIPTNHFYLGDIYLIKAKDVMRPNLTVREGIGKHLRLDDFMHVSNSSFIYNRSNNLSSYMHFAEIVISGGMSIPKILTIVDAQSILSAGVGKHAVPQV